MFGTTHFGLSHLCESILGLDLRDNGMVFTDLFGLQLCLHWLSLHIAAFKPM